MPYRHAFTETKKLTYVGADVPWAGIKPDVTIDTKSQRICAPDASFHGLIHFQVMEHVPDYIAFLSECFRLLKPGGVMFCTVPFAFEFHGVPSDYRRWTHEGLKFDLEKCGFTILKTEAIESDFLSILTICELYLARKFGYVVTKPIFLGMNILGLLGCHQEKGLIPLTNGVVCLKPK
jgi:SAM-dependent methyltransferase